MMRARREVHLSNAIELMSQANICVTNNVAVFDMLVSPQLRLSSSSVKTSLNVYRQNLNICAITRGTSD